MSEEERVYYDQAARFGGKVSGLEYLQLIIGAQPGQVTVDHEIDSRLTDLPERAETEGDLIWAATDETRNGEPWALLIEHKTKANHSAVTQCLDYGSHLYEFVRPDGLPGSRYEIGLVVVNLSGSLTIQQKRFAGTIVSNSNAIPMVNFAEFSADNVMKRIEAGELGLTCLMWIPLMQGGCESSMIERWKVQYQREPDEEKRSIFRSISLVFANLVKHKETWQTALGALEKKMPIPEIIQEWVNETATEAEARGEAKGRSEGFAKARFIFAIQDAQAKLGEAVTPADELLAKSITDLQKLADGYADKSIGNE